MIDVFTIDVGSVSAFVEFFRRPHLCFSALLEESSGAAGGGV